MTRVSPGDIGKDFANALNEVVVGTKVLLEVRLHAGMMFRKEEEAFLLDMGSTFKKEIGNATVNTKINLEYEAKPDELMAAL